MTNKYLLLNTVLLIMLSACSHDEHVDVDSQAIMSYKVAIVLPQDNQECWNRTVDWALNNIKLAQKGQESRVELDIEWHDENDREIEDYFRKVAHDPKYTAMIGPMTSDKAQLAAGIFGETEKTLILPVASSTEFQRIFAGRNNIWNLVESDISQSEILLTQAKLSGLDYVSLLTADNNYGKSFNDWFAYQAYEIGLQVKDVFIYRNHEELREAIEKISQYKKPYATFLMFAPGNVEDAVVFDKKYGELKGSKDYLPFPTVMCSDIVNSSKIATRMEHSIYEGISPTADPTSGFIEAYKLKFGVEPINAEPHLFDAVTLLCYALKFGGDDNLSESIKVIVDGRNKGDYSWLPDDMHNTFSLLSEGNTPDLRGVTGDWTFDSRHHASVLNTIYSHWILRDGKYSTIEYLSVDGLSRTVSSYQAWEQQNSNIQNFNPNQPAIEYGALNDNYAVVLATSDTWSNYRHQADALAMYQLLKRHGYDDDHILLIMEDNLAYDPRNLYPGVIKIRPEGNNVHENVTVDYKLSSITFQDFQNIMKGNTSHEIEEVLPANENDNVILFWCGHGNRNMLAWGSNKTVSGVEMRELIKDMKAKGKYRKLLLVMDACYSGTLGEACKGIPGVLVITAANAFEPSKADMRDSEMGIWLSNGFTRVFQETIDFNPSISLRDLYYTLARHTVGSHATVYNAEYYGNLYTSSIDEYLNNSH